VKIEKEDLKKSSLTANLGKAQLLSKG